MNFWNRHYVKVFRKSSTTNILAWGAAVSGAEHLKHIAYSLLNTTRKRRKGDDEESESLALADKL